MRTNSLNAPMYALFSRLKLDRPQIEDLASQYSNGRTVRSSQLSELEARQLVKDLNALLAIYDKEKTSAAQMKRHIIAMAHEMGWELGNGSINMDKLNGWCTRYGYLHKPLDDYIYKELPTLVTQFKNVLKAFKQQLNGNKP